MSREWVTRTLASGGALLLINSAYLAAFASPTLFYYANVALHVILGALLFGLGARWLAGRWRGIGAMALVTAALLAAGGALGLVLTVTGATRTYRWLLLTHIAVATAGGLAAVLLVGRALLRDAAGRLKPSVAITALVLAAAGAWTTSLVARARAGERLAHRIENPLNPPASMEEEGAGERSPFFPSSADTNVGGIIPANFFMTSETCGRCHKDIYEQWNSSAHHFSSFNNQWYRKSIEYMQDVVGTQPSKWCAGCHDHAVFFNGRFDRPIKEQIDTPEAQAGLACTSCHAITHVDSTMGQGDFTIEYPPLHDLAASEQPAAAVRARPADATSIRSRTARRS